MADLVALLTARKECESRGQLILVTALALAAIFLGLAVIVNSAIFTENLATRSENVESTEALEYRHSVTQYTEGVIEFANENNDSNHGEIRDDVREGIIDASNYSRIQNALGGASVSLKYVDDTEGARIFQNDDSTFTNNETTNEPDWTLATDIENTRSFELNVTSFPAASSDFKIIATNSSGETWEMEVTDTTLTVRNPAGTDQTCTYSTLESVDITGATVNGSPCPALIDTEDGEPMHFGAGFDNEYSIEFDNGDDIEGNYSVVIDNRSVGAIRDIDFAAESGPGTGPYVRPAMYSATMDLEYETARVRYGTKVTVAPGEPQ